MSAHCLLSRPVQTVILLLTAISLSPQSPAAAKAPNVVLLLADDLGSKDIGCYGGPVKDTGVGQISCKTVFASLTSIPALPFAQLPGRHY